MQAVQEQAKDPDEPLSGWLEHGAPMGLSQPIVPGKLFPAQEAHPDLSLDDLSALATVKANHPSFSELHGEEIAPGHSLLQSQLNAGFGLLFHDRAAAELHLGAKVHPAPMGNIAKPKADGSMKHRLIQDL